MRFGLKTSEQKFRLGNLHVFLKIQNLLNGTFKKNSVRSKVSKFYVDSESKDRRRFGCTVLKPYSFKNACFLTFNGRFT